MVTPPIALKAWLARRIYKKVAPVVIPIVKERALRIHEILKKPLITPERVVTITKPAVIIREKMEQPVMSQERARQITKIVTSPAAWIRRQTEIALGRKIPEYFSKEIFKYLETKELQSTGEEATRLYDEAQSKGWIKEDVWTGPISDYEKFQKSIKSYESSEKRIKELTPGVIEVIKAAEEAKEERPWLVRKVGLPAYRWTGVRIAAIEARPAPTVYERIKKGVQVTPYRLGQIFVAGVPIAVGEFVRRPKGVTELVIPSVTMAGVGMAVGMRERPIETTSELVTSAVLMGVGIKGTGVTLRGTGRLTGAISRKHYGFRPIKGGEPLPHKSRAAVVKQIFREDYIVGTRAVPSPIGRYIKPRIPDTTTYGKDIKGTHMTVGSQHMMGYGEPFTKMVWSKQTMTPWEYSKGTLLHKVGGSVIYEIKAKTVKLPKTLEDNIYKSIKKEGHFKQYADEVVDIALKESAKLGEPIVVAPPKSVIGLFHPENEAFLVYGSKAARKITGRQFLGFTDTGIRIVRLRLGSQPKLKPRIPIIQSMAENIKFNIKASDHYVKAMAEDMNIKGGQLYKGKLMFPGEYEIPWQHGKIHNIANETRMRAIRDEYRLDVSNLEIHLMAKYHDMAKITSHETQPFKHGPAVARALREGYLTDPLFDKLTKVQKGKIIRAIELHTTIRPGLLHKILYRPTPHAKLLTRADRLDLVRFGYVIDYTKLFEFKTKGGETMLTNFAKKWSINLKRATRKNYESLARRFVSEEKKILNELRQKGELRRYKGKSYKYEKPKGYEYHKYYEPRIYPHVKPRKYPPLVPHIDRYPIYEPAKLPYAIPITEYVAPPEKIEIYPPYRETRITIPPPKIPILDLKKKPRRRKIPLPEYYEFREIAPVMSPQELIGGAFGIKPIKRTTKKGGKKKKK